SVESEHGPSAADILAALEQAYQRQVAESATAAESEAPEAGASAEGDLDGAATAVPSPTAPPPTTVPEAEAIAATPASEGRLAESDSENVTGDAYVASEAVQVSTAPPADQNQTVQSIAVVYQPVYVLPPATGVSPASTPPRRSVGRDPWAPLTISPRHNPWATSAAQGGAWATVGVAGGVWAGGFAPQR
ncbi:MAG TPA: hypothetical protein VFU02_04180, partial [Polyangiaceae bacterium]|nr:hypothetical protein [Polyangiaceae bacterium]